MRRALAGLLVAAFLWTPAGFAQGGAALPPAEDEIAAMERAFAQVVGFFKEFILEIKGSLTMLDDRVKSLERTSLILKLGLEELAAHYKRGWEELAGRLTKFESAVVPAIMALEGRVTAIEKYDFVSLERRIAALAMASEALGIGIENTRAKIEGLEVALAGIRTTVDDLPAVVDEVRGDISVFREELDAFKAKYAADQQAMWAAVFLVPLAVGGLLFLLLSPRS